MNIPNNHVPAGVTPLAVNPNWYIIHGDQLQWLPPLRWLLPGILPVDGLSVLYGPSGTGKSFVALDIGLRLARYVPVLYIASEGEYGFRQRTAAWTQHHRCDLGKFYMCIGAVNILNTHELMQFADAVRPLQAKLIIIDTLARSMTGADENSTRDMGLYIAACESIKHNLHSTVLIVHHTNKGGQAERGNSALRGSCDTMIHINMTDDLIRLSCAKTKDIQPFEDTYLRLLPVSVTLDGTTVESRVVVKADKIIESKNDPLTVNQRKLLEGLSLAVFENGADLGDLMETLDLPPTTKGSTLRTLSSLMKRGYVEQNGKRSPYRLTSSGQDLLDSRTLKNHQNHTILQNHDSIESFDNTESGIVDNLKVQQSFLTENGLAHYKHNS